MDMHKKIMRNKKASAIEMTATHTSEISQFTTQVFQVEGRITQLFWGLDKWWTTIIIISCVSMFLILLLSRTVFTSFASGRRLSVETFSHNFSAKNTCKLDDEYQVDKKPIGAGSCGSVTQAKNKHTGAIRAVKSIDKSKVPDKRRFQDEVDIQAQLDHPNIVKLFEWFEDAKRYYLIMELCTGGELFDHIIKEVEKNDGHGFTEIVAASYMSQILGAIGYLHDKQIAHRDIKPENFLLQNKDASAAIKVIDFGLAKKFVKGESKLTTKAGTPYYVAPEVIKKNKDSGYNELCDIWSCGVLAYIMLGGHPPFYGDTNAEILKMVVAGTYDFPSPGWDTTSQEAKDFIAKMLVPVEKRPCAIDIKEHQWLQKKDAKKAGELSKDLGNKFKHFLGKSKLKKICLTLMAQQMKEEELTMMQADFKLLDKNNDGTLTIQEIVEGMKKKGITGIDEALLRRLDTDKSGCIDYSEFLAASLSMRTNWQKDQLWAAFRIFDKDGNGTIDSSELAQVVGKTAPAIGKLMKEADTNKDGVIDFEEFSAMMNK
jgi:calcium-dependent protein kinase